MSNILVNGEHRSIDNDETIADLLTKLGLDNKRLAVELNREIVSRSEFGTTRLNDGDCIEIVQAIGGGMGDSVIG